MAVASGEDAVDLLKTGEHRFGVALVDFLMPGMDGKATCAALRAVQADLPVVLMSGDVNSDRLDEAMTAGAAAFIPKPFDATQLQRTIDSAMPAGPRSAARCGLSADSTTA